MFNFQWKVKKKINILIYNFHSFYQNFLALNHNYESYLSQLFLSYYLILLESVKQFQSYIYIFIQYSNLNFVLKKKNKIYFCNLLRTQKFIHLISEIQTVRALTNKNPTPISRERKFYLRKKILGKCIP